MVKHRKGPPTPVLTAEYLGGMTSVDLSLKYQMTPSGVLGRLARAGVAIRPPRRRSLGDRSTNEVVSAYQAGMSMADIAKNLSVTRNCVQRVLADAGVEMHPHGLRSRTIKIPRDPASLGYLCGLFDGEGNLQFRDKTKKDTVSCKLTIYNTCPEVMQWLTKTIGGKPLVDTARTIKKGWLPIGSWNVYRAQDVAALLKAMLPHLIVKREQAKRALMLFRTKFKVHDSPPCITQSK